MSWVKTTGSMGSSVFANVRLVWLTRMFLRPRSPKHPCENPLIGAFFCFFWRKHTNSPKEVSLPKPEPLTLFKGWETWAVSDVSVVDGLVLSHPQHRNYAVETPTRTARETVE